MKLRVDEVPSTGLNLRWEEPPERLDERIGRHSGAAPDAGRARPASPVALPEARTPIQAELAAARVGRTVAAVGRIGVTVSLVCSRCLRPVEARLDVPAAQLFVPLARELAEAGRERPAAGRGRRAGGRAAREDGEEQEGPLEPLDLSGLPFDLPGEDLEVVEYTGAEIDLTQAVVDLVVLALPVQPLCSDACKGLCPHCGHDLNAGPCACEEDRVDPRFAKLRSLKLR